MRITELHGAGAETYSIRLYTLFPRFGDIQIFENIVKGTSKPKESGVVKRNKDFEV